MTKVFLIVWLDDASLRYFRFMQRYYIFRQVIIKIIIWYLHNSWQNKKKNKQNVSFTKKYYNCNFQRDFIFKFHSNERFYLQALLLCCIRCFYFQEIRSYRSSIIYTKDLLLYLMYSLENVTIIIFFNEYY